MKKILFVCIGNTCRSQMAEAFALRHGEGKVEILSAGTNAFGSVHPDTIEAMRDIDIDISAQTSDQLTGEMIDWADTIVTLGCCTADELCPVTFEGEKLDWPIDDPFGRPSIVMERVRDDIEERVKELIGE